MKREDWLSYVNKGEKVPNEDLNHISEILFPTITGKGKTFEYNFLSYYFFYFDLAKKVNNEKINKTLISAPFPKALQDMLYNSSCTIYKTILFDYSKQDLSLIKNYKDEFFLDKKSKVKYDLIVLDYLASNSKLNYPYDENPERELIIGDDQVDYILTKNLNPGGSLIIIDPIGSICSFNLNLEDCFDEIADNEEDDLIIENIEFNFLQLPFMTTTFMSNLKRPALNRSFKKKYLPYVHKICSLHKNYYSNYESPNAILINSEIKYDVNLIDYNLKEKDNSWIVNKSKIGIEDWAPANNLVLNKNLLSYQELEKKSLKSISNQIIIGQPWGRVLDNLSVEYERKDKRIIDNDKTHLLVFDDNNLEVASEENFFWELTGAEILMYGNKNLFKERRNFRFKTFLGDLFRFDPDEFLQKSKDDFISETFQNIFDLGNDNWEYLDDFPKWEDLTVKKGDLLINHQATACFIYDSIEKVIIPGPETILIRSDYNNFLHDLLTSNNFNNIFSGHIRSLNHMSRSGNLLSEFSKIEIPLQNNIEELEKILTSDKYEQTNLLKKFLNKILKELLGWEIEISDDKVEGLLPILLIVDGQVESFILFTGDRNNEEIIDIHNEIFDLINVEKGFLINTNMKSSIITKRKKINPIDKIIYTPNMLYPGDFDDVDTQPFKSSDNSHVIHLLSKLQQETSKNHQETNAKIDQTLKTVNRIDKNMDVLAKIEGLKINSNDTNIEETISNIVNLIKDKYDFKDVKEYIESVTKWFKYWDKLEVLSQNFMAQSEYLYSSIKSSEFDDYSPFVLYSCRALEYELLQKIFVGYHDYINAKYTDKEMLFDYNKESLNSKTVRDIETGIINSFRRYIISGNPKYTLGDMRLLLNILPSKSKPKGSKRFQVLLALQELNEFIETKIGDIPSKFIKDIENISSNYRNPSAHIGVINKQKADEFYEIYKKMMNDLLSGFDQSSISL